MSASKKPPPVTARAFCFARKGLETQQDYCNKEIAKWQGSPPISHSSFSSSVIQS